MKILFTLILFFLPPGVLHAQEMSLLPRPIPAPTTPRTAMLLDVYDKVPSKDERIKLRRNASVIKQDKDARVFIIAYGGRRTFTGEAAKKANRIGKYLVEKQAIEIKRIVMIDGGYRENGGIDLFLVPPGATEPTPNPTVNASEAQIYRAKRKKRKRRRASPAPMKLLQARRRKRALS